MPRRNCELAEKACGREFETKAYLVGGGIGSRCWGRPEKDYV